MWKLGIFCCALFLLSDEIANCGGTIPVCLTNCIQCKHMFGRYFQGRVCGDACITTNGRMIPDCNNPGTLGNYLKRFYK